MRGRVGLFDWIKWTHYVTTFYCMVLFWEAEWATSIRRDIYLTADTGGPNPNPNPNPNPIRRDIYLTADTRLKGGVGRDTLHFTLYTLTRTDRHNYSSVI